MDLVPDSVAAFVCVVYVRGDLKLNATPFWVELADRVSGVRVTKRTSKFAIPRRNLFETEKVQNVGLNIF